MANLAMDKLTNFKIFVGLFVNVVLASAMCAQASRQLQVEVGPNQETRILASDVSYGEVLRALEKKLGWEIEIPSLANELKISYVRVETTEPVVALAKLLEGSRFGYALLTGLNKSKSVRVVVIPLTPREVSVTHETASSSAISGNAVTGVSMPLRTQGLAVTPIKSDAAASGADTEQSEALSTMPLTEAINAMGVPPDVSPADVGRAITMPLTEAINAMGAPPGLSPNDVGSTTTLPLSDASKMMGVPPGLSPSDVGKTTTLPLPTGSGKRP